MNEAIARHIGIDRLKTTKNVKKYIEKGQGSQSERCKGKSEQFLKCTQQNLRLGISNRDIKEFTSELKIGISSKNEFIILTKTEACW